MSDMDYTIQGILETCLYVEDLQNAKKFYEGVLRLECVAEQPGRHCFFRCGSSMLLLFDPQASRTGTDLPAHGAIGPGHVAFAVPLEDIAWWRLWLAKQGVAIEREIQWPQGGYSLYFRDPSGNSLELATPQIWKFPG
jgi:catechol 2,3-dioxygenase-like lactoylglutathione lyase family enzyme